MTYGYSARIIDENKEADTDMLGVRLGRHCIARDISVTEVARHLNVSTQTVYNWFCGISSPRDTHVVGRVEAYIAQLT